MLYCTVSSKEGERTQSRVRICWCERNSVQDASERTREGDEGTEYNDSVRDIAWAQSEWKLHELLFLRKVQRMQGQAGVGEEST